MQKTFFLRPLKYLTLGFISFFSAGELWAQVSYTISGSVFRDANGNVLIDSGEGGVSNLGASVPLYVYLVNTSGSIVRKSTVGVTGTFSFGSVIRQAYTLHLSTQDHAINTSPTIDKTLPGRWMHTGERLVTVDAAADGMIAIPNRPAGNTTGILLGLQEAPASGAVNEQIPQPAVDQEIALDGSEAPAFYGTDGEDGAYTGSSGAITTPQGIVITSLPTNGQLWYYGGSVPILIDASKIGPSFIYDPSGFTIRLTGSGYTSTTFEYAYVDAAGVSDPNPASYTLYWASPLPVGLTAFEAFISNGSVSLSWITATERNNKLFDIERSADAVDWRVIGSVKSRALNGNSSGEIVYGHVDESPLSGKNHYRLKQTDLDGSFTYSKIVSLNFIPEGEVSIYPNPVAGELKIKGLEGTEILRIYDLTGQKVAQAMVASGRATLSIDLSLLVNGVYFLMIEKKDQPYKNVHKILKQ